ncbi:MAG: GIY-YIG nuclease family protein [Acidobacteria bacterium]|nr:GIY-YIG nuclease family protein [Acidobacteriota bacterium]
MPANQLHLTYDGPSCYMLGTGGPLGGNLEWHYVGHTVNERRRMCQYGRDGSHLSRIINYHLNQEWHLWYRAISCGSKEAAGIMERAYLKKYIFDWNYLLNSG